MEMKIKPLLSVKNVDVTNATLMEDYNNATSIFNNFFGTMAQIATDSFHEALDIYEEDKKVYRFQCKKAFKALEKELNIFWRNVDWLFEEKKYVYIDYLARTTKALDSDVRKLYLAISMSLANTGVKDNTRLAWVYVCDLIIHQMLSSYRRFVDGVVEATKNPRLRDTFKWADPTHLANLSTDLINSLHTLHVPMHDNVGLAMDIIAKHIMSPTWQDNAALEVLEYEDHADYRQALAPVIEEYKERREQKEREERKAAEKYKQRKARERASQQAMPRQDVAETLSQKFKVSHL